MTPRKLATLLLLLALAASPVLTGCLGSAQATAIEQQSRADDRASEWAGDATLTMIVGVEGTFPTFGDHGADEDASYWDRAREDEEKGDGRAVLWVYRYVSATEPDTLLQVVVDEDGGIVATDEEPRGSDDEPLDPWEIDSDQAAEIAREENEGLREGTDSERYGMVLVLHNSDETENAVWVVLGGGGDRSGGGGGVVTIDAVTGEVLGSFGGFRGG